MPVTIVPLRTSLAQIADPRKAQGLRHPLVAILCLCAAALLAGAKDRVLSLLPLTPWKPNSASEIG